MCSRGHKWTELLFRLRAGKWCPACNSWSSADELARLLTDLDLESKRAYTSPQLQGHIYQLALSDGLILLEADEEAVFVEDEAGAARRSAIKARTLAALSAGYNLIRLEERLLQDKTVATAWLQTAVVSYDQLIVSDPERYGWLFQINDKPPSPQPAPALMPVPVSVPLVAPPQSPVAAGATAQLTAACKVGVCGYVRVSTNEQAVNGVSLASQESAIRAYATYEDIPIKGIWRDEGLSGKEMKNRKGLQDLLAQLGSGDKVVIYSSSRLARNTRDLLEIVDTIKARNASLVYLDLKLDNSTPVGQLTEQFMASLSQFESNTISARVSANMSYLKSQGQLRSKPPYGWKFVGKKVPFAPDEAEQAGIQRIKALYEKSPNASLCSLCKVLDAEKVPCRKAKRWYASRLKSILEQPGIVSAPAVPRPTINVPR